MKPLELTVYPEGGCETAAHCALKRGCVECVDDVDKRFTDAELAAEMLNAVFHEAECEVRGRKLAGKFPAHPAIDHYVKHNHEFGRQAVILERFATLPHYDEEAAS